MLGSLEPRFWEREFVKLQIIVAKRGKTGNSFRTRKIVETKIEHNAKLIKEYSSVFIKRC